MASKRFEQLQQKAQQGIDLHKQNSKIINQKGIEDIKVDIIKENPFQPRYIISQESINELANSISTNGLLSPIVVLKKDDIYTLIAGQRRLLATKQLGISTIKAIVKQDIEDREIRKLAFIENSNRENMTPIEESKCLKMIKVDYGNCSIRELSSIVNKSKSYIDRRLKISELSEKHLNHLEKEGITNISLLLFISNNKDKINPLDINQNTDAEQLIQEINTNNGSIKDNKKHISDKKQPNKNHTTQGLVKGTGDTILNIEQTIKKTDNATFKKMIGEMQDIVDMELGNNIITMSFEANHIKGVIGALKGIIDRYQ